MPNTKAYNAAYYLTHKEKWKGTPEKNAYMKKWHAAHREEQKAYRAVYFASERGRAAVQRYRDSEKGITTLFRDGIRSAARKRG